VGSAGAFTQAWARAGCALGPSASLGACAALGASVVSMATGAGGTRSRLLRLSSARALLLIARRRLECTHGSGGVAVARRRLHAQPMVRAGRIRIAGRMRSAMPCLSCVPTGWRGRRPWPSGASPARRDTASVIIWAGGGGAARRSLHLPPWRALGASTTLGARRSLGAPAALGASASLRAPAVSIALRARWARPVHA